jgi:hypothetical protein
MAPPAAHPVSRPANPDAPSLLILPGEIRNGIYESFFKLDQPILRTFTCPGDGPLIPSSRSTVFRGISLLSTCQQIFNEAFGILYTHNTFLFTGTTGEPGSLE